MKSYLRGFGPCHGSRTSPIVQTGVRVYHGAEKTFLNPTALRRSTEKPDETCKDRTSCHYRRINADRLGGTR